MLSPDFEILDPRMRRRVLGNVFVEKLFSGMRWADHVAQRGVMIP